MRTARTARTGPTQYLAQVSKGRHHGKKFITTSDNMLRESLSGLALRHADILKVTFDPTFVTRRDVATARSH